MDDGQPHSAAKAGVAGDDPGGGKAGYCACAGGPTTMPTATVAHAAAPHYHNAVSKYDVGEDKQQRKN